MTMHGSVYGGQLAPSSLFHRGRFGRLFPTLPPFDPPGNDEAEKLQWLEDLAGQMLETPDQAEDASLDNERIPAGYTYFGQFVDHDITFDPVSTLERANDPTQLRNFRSPSFDLDSLYGMGPDLAPFMYESTRHGLLLLGRGVNPFERDLPRNLPNQPSEERRALIGDPRNDENVVVSQLHLVFVLFHNRVMEELAMHGLEGRDAFREAQRIVRWHYQWVVIHDFLVRLVGRELVDSLLASHESPRRYSACARHYVTEPFMPMEFAGAAYRMGHSMVRSTYALSDALESVAGRIPIFVPPSTSPGPLDDLRGFRILPQLWTVQWDRFLPFDTAGSLQFSRRIDTKLAFRLGAIPHGPGGQNALASLNLRRGWRLGLPSGQAAARAFGITPTVNADGEDPLFWYVLAEAEANGGKSLGAVGARIVAEVFAGLLACDPNAYINVQPGWTPACERHVAVPALGSAFGLRDIVAFSGAPVTAADIAGLSGGQSAA